MRAGKLDREITIEAVATVLDEYGTPDEEWTPVATLRAQIVEASTDEYIRAYGASTEHVVIFRTRYLANVDPRDRVVFEGGIFGIKQVKEIGRRRGLELRCERSGP